MKTQIFDMDFDKDLERDLVRDLASALAASLDSLSDPLPVNGSILNTGILNTIKVVGNSILAIGLDLLKIRDYRLYEGLGHKNMSAYVSYLVKESKKDRSSIYKWLNIGEVYIKYRDKLTEIGFTTKDGPTKLPYLERALKNNHEKEVYDNLMKMKQLEFSKYARSIVENISEAGVNSDLNSDENSHVNMEEREEKWGYKYFYKGRVAIKLNRKIGKNALRNLRPAIRLGFNILARGTSVCAVHLDSLEELKLYGPIAIKAREELQRGLRDNS